MLNLISKGDLDTGLVKRYICDTLEDFAELPIVAAGSTVSVITTGETYKIDKEGKWNLDSTIGGEGSGVPGTPGKDGYTPIKGVDYFTEEDKAELVEDVLEAVPSKPVYDEELNTVFCNGVGVVIDDTGAANKITYNLDYNTQETLIVPYGVNIYGGGNGLVQKSTHAATSIVMNSGNVANLRGGGFGCCNVGFSSIVVNGGKITACVSGGGANNRETTDSSGNIVGHAAIVFNNGETLMIYGGSATGLATTGVVSIEMNGGTVHWLTAGGSNGMTSTTKVHINGGHVDIAQSVNRGSVGNAIMVVSGGVVDHLYGGGETADSTVTGTCERTVLNVFGGQVNTIAKGSYKGVEDTFHVSGKYAPGIIGNEEEAINLNMKEAQLVDVVAAVWGNLQ